MPAELLPVIFFLIALFYSSVGFGGGSSYLAVLSLFIVDFFEIRTTALLLNVCVVSIGTLFYIRDHVFDLKRFWPFLISGIPMAFLGAQLPFTRQAFFLILGSALLLSGASLILKIVRLQLKSEKFSIPRKLSLGGGVGLLSGISGIGGGIFLSPLLNMMNWANPRTIASLASVYILANSLSGLAGIAVSGSFRIDAELMLQLAFSVILGGSLGSWLSSRKLDLRIIGGLTAILVIYAGLRLILLHGFGIRV